MKGLIHSLRLRLAVTGFLTAYAPTLILLIVSVIISGNVDTSISTGEDGAVLETETVARSGIPVPVVVGVAVGFIPFAAAFAWWWSGRALRPLAEAIALQEGLIEEASHELRTPLAVLANNAQVLLSHPDPTIDIYRSGLERSELAATRMTETIESLLVDARGRARTIDRVPTDLSELAATCVESARPLAASRGITLQLDGRRRVEAPVDRVSVGRAITNLVTNAIQHGPAGSTVHVRVATEPDPTGRGGEAAIVDVTDAGPGIPEADQARIFERYWRADDGDGAGIGLAIVEQVAAAHGGSVGVVSPVGEGVGSRFTLTLAR